MTLRSAVVFALMTLGDEFISKLKRRRALDLKWRELQTLHGVETLEALSEFLASKGYPEVPVSSDIDQVADGYRMAAWRRGARKIRRRGTIEVLCGVVVTGVSLLLGFEWGVPVGVVVVAYGVYHFLLGSLCSPNRLTLWMTKKWEARAMPKPHGSRCGNR